MDLSKDGIEVIEAMFKRRFNEKTIDKIALCGCSNSYEEFWADLVKLSEGKCIQGCGTDYWYSMVELCFCMNDGIKEKARECPRISMLGKMRAKPTVWSETPIT